MKEVLAWLVNLFEGLDELHRDYQKYDKELDRFLVGRLRVIKITQDFYN